MAETQKSETRTEAGKAEAQNAGGAGASAGKAKAPGPMKAIEALKAQHREVEALLSPAAGAEGTLEAVRAVAVAWAPHVRHEEAQIYPSARGAGDPALDLEVGVAETRADLVKLLLGDLLDPASDPRRAAKWRVLCEELGALIAAEEAEETGVFARLAAAGVELRPPGEGADEDRAGGAEATTGGSLPAPRALRLQGAAKGGRLHEESETMRRNTPDRDERGRFMSDDDDRDDGRSSRASGRQRDEEGRFTSGDDRGDGGRGSRAYGRRRDEEGRFMSDDRSSGSSGYRDDERGYRSRDDDDRRYGARSRDDDRRYSRDHGQGGWFGDPEGHSEASRRGWEDRDRGRSMASRREDEDRRYGRSYDDDRRRSRDDDDRRYSRDRGQGGWFGDPEGHSEASRRGWEGRRSDDDDDRGYRARGGRGGYDDDRRRSRYEDDDDDRYSRDRGQGGWFGDPEGHSEASRRGWESRRR